MHEHLPYFISITFIVTTFLTVYLLYLANKSVVAFSVVLGWIILQGFVAYTGFYTFTGSLPPRFTLAVLPGLLLIISLFFTPNGKAYLNRFDLGMLTLLHVVRIPVELALYWLYQHGMVPQLMTFEGRNVDIVAGATAPLVWYFGFYKPILSKKIILWWNIACLALLLNIVVNAALSAPFPFQQFAFEQPNVAVFYYPFIWLPCCIVPVVLLSHLAAIRKLLLNK